jgi:hypothetical protein
MTRPRRRFLRWLEVLAFGPDDPITVARPRRTHTGFHAPSRVRVGVYPLSEHDVDLTAGRITVRAFKAAAVPQRRKTQRQARKRNRRG